jgi:hypothetical protein
MLVSGAINASFAQRIRCLGAIDGAAHSAVVERRRSQRANYCVRKLSALDTVSSGGGLLMMEVATGADDSASRRRPSVNSVRVFPVLTWRRAPQAFACYRECREQGMSRPQRRREILQFQQPEYALGA